eukprot:TRINITY_DN62103_c0_g1_i1.p1 TRINITY_DN62103_c0_g1~~TRINITY_DN62103_c0_g1_i1.p1  ORF type:complete len:338 (+),score=13.05 TRINITY_DN62103_c0_g1_i1:45-1058(+)
MSTIGQLLVLFVVVTVGGRDFYGILGIQRGASPKEIRSAYRKLAVKWHPDHNKEEGAKEQFQEISQAYEILSDKTKRQRYDAYGEDGLNDNAGGGGGFGDIFERAFGRFGGFRDATRTENQGPDLVIPLKVTLRDLYVGKSFTVHRSKWARQAGGTPRECHCKRSNTIHIQFGGSGIQTMSSGCDECRNLWPKERQHSALFVTIERGMMNGDQIVFEGEADAVGDDVPGNLIFSIVQDDSYPNWQRNGEDLHIHIHITLREALLGFERALVHIDGHHVDLVSNKIIQPEEMVGYPGEGMPIRDTPSERGTLWVTYHVNFPTELTADQRAAIATSFHS